ncbi:proline iminopeptidase [Ephemerocybe angulata]|uniref:Proline iminopeptidase n=1 Tax=Ephemerocybe angulata TaxID=980116 RepID=A0A8H6HDR8_9AGAR|nr:proline iminopeptidase [Tulosesus angulatus]
MIEGTVQFLINGEEFRTYYQIHGTIADDSLPPLIAIHGGPGYTHDYLGPLADIAKSNPLQPVIFYDQLGNGKSSRLTSKPPDFFSVRLYVDEIANLVEKLNLTSYHILGHSWGGPLAAEFEVQLQPRGLKSLVIANSLASMALVGKSFSERIDTLDNPEEVRAGMAKKKTDPKAYRAAMMALYGRYAIRFVKEDPIPKELRVLDTVLGDEETGEGGDPTVSDNMGPKTRNWTIIDRLPSIRVPLLLLTGKEDMLQGYASEPYFWRVNKARWIEFQNSSHVPFWEEREKFMTTVNEWLQRLD